MERKTSVILASGLRRLERGLTRHGWSGVLAIAWRALRAVGPGGVAQLAAGDRPFLSVTRQETPKSRRQPWPPALDAEGRISAETWERWLAVTRRQAAKPGMAVFVVDARGAADQAFGRTRAAIFGLDPKAIVLTEPPAEPELAALYVFLKAGDVPTAELPGLLAEAIETTAQVVTFDLFHQTDDNVRLTLAPGANPVLLQACDFILSRCALTGAVLRETRAGDPRDRILAWAAARSVAQARAGWRHIGRPLVCAAVSGDDLAFARTPAPVLARPAGDGVSVVICTKDKGRLVRQLVRQLLTLSDCVREVVILSNNTTHPYALSVLEDLSRNQRVEVLRRDEPFNFSRLCNEGAKRTQGDGPLLFLNDDIVPVKDDWLQMLQSALAQSGVGAVGPLLLYPSERVQHAGMYLRFPDGAGHYLKGADVPPDDALGLAAAPREVSCLTGAVMLTDRRVFEQVGGFDESLAISFQDVDYCLRLYRAGLRNVFEPRSVLIHMESVSLDNADTDPTLLAQRYHEKRLMLDRWASAFPTDPFWPAELDPADESLRRLLLP